MNTKSNNNAENQNMEKLKEIPKWTRKYAQNRTLTILVLMVMTVLWGMIIAALIGFPSALAVIGFRKGNMVLGFVGIGILVAILVALAKLYLVIYAKFGGKNKGLIDQLIDRWIYGKEGAASMPQPKLSKTMIRLDIFVGIVYMVCLLGTMNLAMAGYIPIKFILPLMALFVIPFGVYSYFMQRPRLGPATLIFPILYTIHAILILAGIPIYFKGTFAVPLNLLLPVVYTLAAYLFGHLYSRYALKKLKDISHFHGDTANGA